MKEKKLELLAPAGSVTTLKAVVNAGADAVYVGGSMFGARAYAKNLTTEELISGIDYAHLHGSKVFLTVNTLLKNREIEEELIPYLTPYYEAGLDAVIVQDFGVVKMIREYFPDLPLHASTQMTIAGTGGAMFMQELGLTRIVTARELSLREIAEIKKKTDLEIESFVHGALCYSYSGQCLMSSMLGGRSGNRGRCAGTCRLPFEVRKKQDVYALSLKDLCTVDFIPELAESGIYSFKIEGRMKAAEYAAGVVSVYRKYMDLYLEKGREACTVTDEDRRKLLDLGNRSGFTKGYYYVHNDKDMVTYEKPAHNSKNNEFLMQEVRETYVEKDKKIPLTAKLTLKADQPAVLEVKTPEAGQAAALNANVSDTDNGSICITGTGAVVETARNRPMEKANILEKINKTGDTPFVFTDIQVEMGCSVFIPVQKLNELRRETLQDMEEKLLAPFKRQNQKSADQCAGNSDEHVPGQLHEALAVHQQDNCPLYVLARTKEQLHAAAESFAVTRIYLDSSVTGRENYRDRLKLLAETVKSSRKECYFALPYIFRFEAAQFYREFWQEFLKTGFDGILVRSYDELGFLEEMNYPKEKICLDSGLYTFSNQAKQAFSHLGYIWDTIPFELNRKELGHRMNDRSELQIFGHIPLMITANCIHKNFSGCDRKKQTEYLTDRYQKRFFAVNHCDECLNVLYNPDCLNLLNQKTSLEALKPAAYRISFSNETGRETEMVLNAYEQIFCNGMDYERAMPDGAWNFTYGHFKRGVE